MKAIVISNCNATAYYNYLRSVFPKWEVRSALCTQAEEWLRDDYKPFLKYLEKVDIFIGLPDIHEKIVPGKLNRNAVTLILPGFLYLGTRPDCFWLDGVQSPMENGIIHSKIAVSAYCLRKTLPGAMTLFQEDHYEKIGYFSEFENSRKTLFETYNDVRIDISGAFEEWSMSGDFMYTPNHPDSRILFDILHIALQKEGYLKTADPESIRNFRRDFDDYLGRGIIWPVYPEISQRFSIKNPKNRWRTSIAKGSGVEFGLEEMLQRSFSVFENTPDIRSLASKSLGGEDKIALYGGS